MKRILIVNGDPRNCLAIHKALAGIPCASFFAYDAVAAVAEARRHNPDLVIVDFRLPAGGGLAVVERLRALPGFASMPIIMIAEHDDRMETERIYDAGVSVLLSKPVKRHLLVSYVREKLPKEASRGNWADRPAAVLE